MHKTLKKRWPWGKCRAARNVHGTCRLISESIHGARLLGPLHACTTVHSFQCQQSLLEPLVIINAVSLGLWEGGRGVRIEVDVSAATVVFSHLVESCCTLQRALVRSRRGETWMQQFNKYLMALSLAY